MHGPFSPKKKEDRIWSWIDNVISDAVVTWRVRHQYKIFIDMILHGSETSFHPHSSLNHHWMWWFTLMNKYVWISFEFARQIKYNLSLQYNDTLPSIVLVAWASIHFPFHSNPLHGTPSPRPTSNTRPNRYRPVGLSSNTILLYYVNQKVQGG